MRLLAISLLLCGSLAAQDLNQPLPLLPSDPLTWFRYSGDAGAGKVEVVAVDGASFPKALRLTTWWVTGPESNVGIRLVGAAGVTQKDMVLATFWVRCIQTETEGCLTRFNVQNVTADHTKSISQTVMPTNGWQQYKLLFQMADSYAQGSFEIDFWTGQQVQVVEVGGITVDDYGPDVRASDLGVGVPYAGFADDAPWHAAAADRIEQIRKGNLTVAVQDSRGSPVAGATVHVRMKKHAFGWGTAVAAGVLLGTSADSDKYRQAILDNFNMAVFENDLKWPGWERNRQLALDGVQWMLNHGIDRVRGHNLIWPGWSNMPQDVLGLIYNPDALRNRILNHMQDEVSANRGTLWDWDVVNEPYNNHDVQSVLGNSEVAAWFNTAHQYDPGARLFLNDFGFMESGGGNPAQRDSDYALITYLDSLGAPVQGIGMQAHFTSPTPPELMLSVFGRFAQLNRAIEITEFDFDTKDEALQAKFTRDLLITVFSQPRIEAFVMWGFWEGRHWRPNGAMIRKDWSTKPNYDVWREMVYGQWWTDVSGMSGDDGTWKVRGFLGDYEVVVTAGDRAVTVSATLTLDGARVAVTLP
jgi:endo-1,4-beta-xylanase